MNVLEHNEQLVMEKRALQQQVGQLAVILAALLGSDHNGEVKITHGLLKAAEGRDVQITTHAKFIRLKVAEVES